MIRVRSKSGNFIALLPETLQGGFSVVATETGVCRMRNSWPCSRLPERPIRFEYASNGYLVNVVGTAYDGEDLLALSNDAQEFGELAMTRRREKKFPEKKREHDFQLSRFTGNVVCTKCNLMPLDDEDSSTPCCGY